MLPLTFNTSNITTSVERGFRPPCTLDGAKGLPRPEWRHVHTVGEYAGEGGNTTGVNYMLPGVYNVSYDVLDDYSNRAVQVSRTVTVKDTTPPVLQLIGEPIVWLKYADFNGSYPDPGANATVSDRPL